MIELVRKTLQLIETLVNKELFSRFLCIVMS